MTGLSADTLELLLAGWLPQQRWFAGKGHAIGPVVVESRARLVDGDPALDHVVVRVDLESVPAQRYQLLLGLRSDAGERLAHAVLGELDGLAVYDALHDRDLTGPLLTWLAGGHTGGGLTFTPNPDPVAGLPLETGLLSRPLGAEQSNSSLVYGGEYILKLFRRLAPGTNPDLEVTRALASVGSAVIAAPLAWVSGPVDGIETTLGMLQPFLVTGTEGWALATSSVRDLYAEGDLHAEEVGGDFAGESHRLGTATALMHVDLARALPTDSVGPDDSRATAVVLKERFAEAVAQVPELAEYAEAAGALYDRLAEHTDEVLVQRIHGDYHLGQVLRTGTGWVVLDFEGEPARSLAERTALMSPLRDVAGMLRSFDYAAKHLLADHHGEATLAYRAVEWAERNRGAFCDGYAEAAGVDPRADLTLLSAFELDKAVYEVVYEARHRPGWLTIPMSSIARLVG